MKTTLLHFRFIRLFHFSSLFRHFGSVCVNENRNQRTHSIAFFIGAPPKEKRRKNEKLIGNDYEMLRTLFLLFIFTAQNANKKWKVKFFTKSLLLIFFFTDFFFSLVISLHIRQNVNRYQTDTNVLFSK